MFVKPVLTYEVSGEQSGAFPVIVVAAGASSRMNGCDKQFLPLRGVPVLARTLRRFSRSPHVSRIIVVTKEESLLAVQRLGEDYGIEKLTDIVPGGADRHASVLCGLSRLRPDENAVLIHDGARPLVDDRVIGNVTAALGSSDAVICAVPVCDTVRRAENGTVTETVDRTGLYAVQTPQGICVDKYRTACALVQDAALLTDDAAVMERAGYPVRVVAGDRRNIKITSPEDVYFAELLLGEEEE